MKKADAAGAKRATKQTAAVAKPGGEKRSAAPKRVAAKAPTKADARAKKPAPRADLGAPVDGFFAKQPRQLGAILDALRALVEEIAPAATSSLKWGMPFYEIGGSMMCALGGHKAHVNLVLAGPATAFADPDGRLAGMGTTGRHLKLTSLDELPRDAVRGWLRVAAALARAKG